MIRFRALSRRMSSLTEHLKIGGQAHDFAIIQMPHDWLLVWLKWANGEPLRMRIWNLTNEHSRLGPADWMQPIHPLFCSLPLSRLHDDNITPWVHVFYAVLCLVMLLMCPPLATIVAMWCLLKGSCSIIHWLVKFKRNQPSTILIDNTRVMLVFCSNNEDYQQMRKPI